MKAYLKAFGVSLVIVLFFLLLISLFQWGIYSVAKEGFENFFGSEMKPFNLKKYLLVWAILSSLLGLVIKSYFKEQS